MHGAGRAPQTLGAQAPAAPRVPVHPAVHPALGGCQRNCDCQSRAPGGVRGRGGMAVCGGSCTSRLLFFDCASDSAAAPQCLPARTRCRGCKGPQAASAAWVPDVLQQQVGAVPGSRTSPARRDSPEAGTTLLPAVLCSSALWTRVQSRVPHRVGCLHHHICMCLRDQAGLLVAAR